MSAKQDRSSTPAPPATGSAPRTRWVIVLSSLLTLAVMAGVIAVGLEGGEEPERGDRAPGLHPDAAGRLRERGDPDRDPGGVAGGCPFDPDRPPRMTFDLPPAGVDFGAVKQGVTLEREVVFHNQGSGPLCIRRVDSGCGCIKARLVGEQHRYEAGESGAVRVTLDTRGRDGLQTKTVTLYTNLVDDPLRKFRVRASITLGMRVGPSFLNFGRATAGHPAKATVRMRTPKDDADWEVTEVVGTDLVDGEPVAYEWEVVELADPRDLIREIVVRHPGITQEDGRSYKDRVVIRTTHPERPEFEIPSHLRIVDPILAVPPRAVLGYVPSRLPPPRIRLVPGDDSVSFAVTDLTFETRAGESVPPGGFGFVATKGQDGTGEWWVETRYDGKSRRPGRIQAVLVVHTDLARMPTVRIDCFANVEK